MMARAAVALIAGPKLFRIMTLTDEQKQTVAGWIAGGANPAEVQKRLAEEFDVRVTYMEVRFLIDDLKVMPKDPEPPAPEPKAEEAVGAMPPDDGGG